MTMWMKATWAFFGLVILSEIGKYLYDNRKKKLAITKKPKLLLHEVLFFSEENAKCKEHPADTLCSLSNCPIKNLNKLLKCFDLAHMTLDICIHLFTSEPIFQKVIELCEKNIKVRILIDMESNSNSACQVDALKAYGVKVIDVKNLHHKFAIVDRRLVISGSANWTSQAIFGNNENIIITNDTNIVKKYVKEYENIWNRYSEID